MTSPSEARYAKEFLAGWGAMDFNGHLANTAYLNLAALAVFRRVPHAPGFVELPLGGGRAGAARVD